MAFSKVSSSSWFESVRVGRRDDEFLLITQRSLVQIQPPQP